MMFECAQCKAWGYTLKPMTQDEVELHLLYVHPLRFHKLFKRNASYLLSGMVIDSKDLRDELTDALKARTE